jgi:hypothetical protein
MCRNPEGVRPFFYSETSMDARNMVWSCEACGKGSKESNAVVCVGRKCLDHSYDEHKWDARAVCFPCYGVTAKTVKRAPDFECTRCRE